MKLNVYLAYLALVALFASSTAQTYLPQSVDVMNDLPGHIDFTFHTNVDFVPMTLKANVSSAQHKQFTFASIGDSKKKTFRNIMPQQLAIDDVISGLLVYKQSAERQAQRWEMPFRYVIQNKSNDTFILNVLDYRWHEALLKQIANETSTRPPTYTCCTTTTTTTTTTTIPPPYGPLAIPAMPARLMEAANCDCDVNYENVLHLEEMLETTLTETQFGKRLLLHVKTMPRASAVDTIRTFFVDKLELSHLANKILQAKFIDDGLLFEMDTPRDAVEVLTQARLRLQGKAWKITRSERDFIEVGGFFRIAK